MVEGAMLEIAMVDLVMVGLVISRRLHMKLRHKRGAKVMTEIC